MSGIRKAYVDTPYGQIHCRISDSGKGDAPVLLFHRTPVTSASFEPVMEHLAGWRTMIAFDTPGFGASFVPDDSASMQDFVTFFGAAVDALGIGSFHLVGHHTGAHFAAELAVHLPQRALSLMVDGAMVTTAEERAGMGAPPPVIVDEDGQYARNAWAFLRPYYTVFDARCIHAEFVGALASTFTRTACMTQVRAHDLAATMAMVACPILATAAADDVFAPQLERISVACPEARTHVYGNAGIASPELQTEVFAELIKRSAEMAT